MLRIKLICTGCIFLLINARETHACVYLLQKRTESDRIDIGGIENENNTKKRNAYN